MSEAGKFGISMSGAGMFGISMSGAGKFGISMSDKDLLSRSTEMQNRHVGMTSPKIGGTGIKICGLSRPCDIDYVNEAMPDYAGFILHFPRSHRNVQPQQARELIQRLRPEIQAVGVFVDQPLSVVCETAKVVGLDIIQLHGSEDNTYIRELRDSVPIQIWKAFKVRSMEDIAEAAKSAADMILLDNGYGTGASFDWTILADRQELLHREFILAGGLTPENISDAVRTLRPAAVDLSSGVETDKHKDCGKILAAVQAVRDV